MREGRWAYETGLLQAQYFRLSVEFMSDSSEIKATSVEKPELTKVISFKVWIKYVRIIMSLSASPSAKNLSTFPIHSPSFFSQTLNTVHCIIIVIFKLYKMHAMAELF